MLLYQVGQWMGMLTKVLLCALFETLLMSQLTLTPLDTCGYQLPEMWLVTLKTIFWHFIALSEVNHHMQLVSAALDNMYNHFFLFSNHVYLITE